MIYEFGYIVLLAIFVTAISACHKVGSVHSNDDTTTQTGVPGDTDTQMDSDGSAGCETGLDDSKRQCNVCPNGSISAVTNAMECLPDVTFSSISSGGRHTCGIRQSDGEVQC